MIAIIPECGKIGWRRKEREKKQSSMKMTIIFDRYVGRIEANRRKTEEGELPPSFLKVNPRRYI